MELDSEKDFVPCPFQEETAKKTANANNSESRVSVSGLIRSSMLKHPQLASMPRA